MLKLNVLGAGFAAIVVAGCATTDSEERLARQIAEQETLVAEYTALSEGEIGEEANDGRICRMSGITGTRVRNTRVCRTPEEWRFLANRADQDHRTLLQGYAQHTSRDEG